VEAALRSGEAGRVIVAPVFSHALHKKSSNFEARLAMVRLAFAGLPQVLVSEVERTLPTPSYTLNTLRRLQSDLPAARLRLVVGTDILAELPHWHQVEEVKKLAPLLVFRRRGTSSGDGIEAELPEVSSSDVRQLLLRRLEPGVAERLRQLVPESVLTYIRENDLYKS
jgi:nicotinate-nucleotide adenylyltransferase